MKATLPMMATAAAVILGTTMFASDASASSDSWKPGPWKPYRKATTRTFLATKMCPFELHAEVVKDEEMGREFTDESGTLVAEEIVGSLFLRFTNNSTGKFVERDANGHGWIFHYPDGSTTQSVIGPYAVPVSTKYNPPNLVPGFYILSGVSVLHVPADFKWTIAYTPPIENICETLAAL